MTGKLLEEINIPLNEENAITIPLSDGSVDKIYRPIECLERNQNNELLLVYGNGDRYKLSQDNTFIKEDFIDIKCEDQSNVYSKRKKSETINVNMLVPYSVVINNTHTYKINVHNDLKRLQVVSNSKNPLFFYYDNIDDGNGEYVLKELNSIGTEVGALKIDTETDIYELNDKFRVANNGSVYIASAQNNRYEIKKAVFEKEYHSTIPEQKEKLIQNRTTSINNTLSSNSLTSISYHTVYRRTIANNALNYINHTWTFTQGNKNGPSGTLIGKLAPYISNITASSTQLTSVPYCWGACMTIDEFDGHISQSWQAGNINTSGYYMSGTAGVDCTGLIWNCYGYSSRPGSFTSGFSQLSSKNDLMRMDACFVNNQTIGTHGVLYRYTDPSNPDLFYTYECSFAAYKCHLYSRKFSQGYNPYRYNGPIINDYPDPM